MAANPLITIAVDFTIQLLSHRLNVRRGRALRALAAKRRWDYFEQLDVPERLESQVLARLGKKGGSLKTVLQLPPSEHSQLMIATLQTGFGHRMEKASVCIFRQLEKRLPAFQVLPLPSSGLRTLVPAFRADKAHFSRYPRFFELFAVKGEVEKFLGEHLGQPGVDYLLGQRELHVGAAGDLFVVLWERRPLVANGIDRLIDVANDLERLLVSHCFDAELLHRAEKAAVADAEEVRMREQADKVMSQGRGY